MLTVVRPAPSHRLFVPLLITYLSKSKATVGHLGETVATWQTVNKGDSGRAGGKEAPGVKTLLTGGTKARVHFAVK